MNKVLLASVAAAGLVVAATAAQAADPIKLTIGGEIKEYVGYATNKKDTTNDRVKFDTMNDGELDFKGETKLDNGVKVGVEVDYAATERDANSGSEKNAAVKNAFTTVSGVFGTFMAGQRTNYTSLVHNTAPTVTTIDGQDNDIHNWINTPTNATTGATFNGTYQTYQKLDDVADKIIYVTPVFAGVSAGFSYTPDVTHSSIGTTSIGAATDKSADNSAAGDLYAYGVTYTNAFGDISIKSDLTGTNANFGDAKTYEGGLQVGYKGFTVGGSALRHLVGSKGTNTSGTSYRTISAIAPGTNFDVGAAYAVGPYKVSFTYYQGSALNSAGTAKDLERHYALGGAYTMGPGIDLRAALIDANYHSRTAGKNTGYGVVTGIDVKF